VLVAETLAWLRRGPGLYLDATLGDGGHADALLEAEPGATLLGCDRDSSALAFARERLARFGDRVTVAHAAFRELPAAHRAAGNTPFTGALFDLGLSSRQLDDPARGMSFQTEGPLDLRMDPSRGDGAAERLQGAEEARSRRCCARTETCARRARSPAPWWRRRAPESWRRHATWFPSWTACSAGALIRGATPRRSRRCASG
jgi:16S rRNA (cytosine1402-N4)-methyltransferase